MYTIENCLSDIKKCEIEISKASAILNHSPAGSLIIQKTKKGSFWYKYDIGNKKYHYIPRNQKNLAEKLAAKRIAAIRLEHYTAIKKSLISFKKNYPKSSFSEEEFLDNHRDLYILAAPYISAPSTLSAWGSVDYERNTQHSETLKFKTLKGDYVRSKSECMIADALFINGIPYRYECKLLLKTNNSQYPDEGYYKTIFYPDFTIKHPITGEKIIWEHFGLISDPNYAANTVSKLQVYTNNGYTSNLNLITTYESLESPLDSATINRIIEKMLLS